MSKEDPEFRAAYDALEDEFTALKGEIEKGMTDLAEGRVHDFNADRIAEKGKAHQTEKIRCNRP